MNPKILAIEARREILISAAADQRMAMARDVLPLRAPLALADQGIAFVRVVRRHPVWVVGVLAIVALVSPRGIGNWAQRSWATWQVVNRLRGP